MLIKKFCFPFFLAGDDDPAPQPDDPAPVPSPEEVLDIHKNFVKKEQYDELQENYRKLVKGILDGGDLPADDPNGEEDLDIAQLKKELYDPNNSLSNLEYVEKTLKLRDAIIEKKGIDPFMPAGINGDPFKTDAERQAAEQSALKVAKVLAEAVQQANGDPATFDIILSKIIA